jgi:hypothetical protein
MNAEDIIDLLPGEFQARLQCDPFFTNLPVVVFEKGSLATELARARAVITEANGKHGVAVIIPQLVANDLSNNLQFGPMTLFLTFQVIENVEQNNKAETGTGLSARKVARKIRDVIKGCNLIGLVQNMETDNPCIEPITIKDQSENIVIYQVNFKCLEVSQEVITQVQLPAITASGTPTAPTFTLACATPGAAIWYTVDDSPVYNGDNTVYPGSTAVLYTAPVPVIPGTPVTVRFAAFLDGAIASSVNRFTLVAVPVS